MRVSNLGISVEAPVGFDVEIYTRPDERGRYRSDAPAILHAANFWLPRDRSDFGHELVQNMRLMDVFLAIIEYGPEAAGKALFAVSGVPSVDAESVSADVIVGPATGQAGAQRFFHVGARAFGLYVVVGSYRLRARSLSPVADLLGTLTVDSR